MACGMQDIADDVYAAITNAPMERHDIVSEAAGYVHSFEQHYMLNVRIHIGWGEPTLAGSCRHYTNGYRDIHLNKLYWQEMTDKQRKALVWHELGHCILGLDHDNRLQPNGCPVNAMYREVPHAVCLEKGGTHATVLSEESEGRLGT
jgi:hypothetical protein